VVEATYRSLVFSVVEQFSFCAVMYEI